MESREEIQSMRVIDLREFLRRHGFQMKHVTRPNGTPGPMRKSELLAAALEIYDEHHEGKPSPTRPSSASKPSPPNPFQSGLPTPPDKRQRQMPPAAIDHPSGSAGSSAGSSAAQEEKPKSRRRSSAWIDPVLLAQMRATTPTKSKDTPSRARPIAPRPLFEAAQEPPPRTLPEPSPIRPPQRIVRQPSSEKKPIRPAQRAPSRVVTPSRKQSVTNRLPLTPRRLAMRKQEPEPPTQDLDQFSRTEVKQVKDIPPPPAPTRSQARSSTEEVEEERPLALYIDDDYVSEEDSDYDADAEEADIDDSDNIDFDDDAEDNERGAFFSFHQQYNDLRYDNVPAPRQEPIDVDADVQEDILVDSDANQKDSAGESDGSSTFETDDEQERNFGDWSTVDIRNWLREHSVRFRTGAQRDEIISIARAHALHLDATAPISQQDSDHRLTTEDEDIVVPSRRRTSDSARRRRVITAPTPDDESDLMEIEPVPPVPDGRRTSKPVRIEFAYDRKPKRVEPSRRRPAFVLFPLIALVAFLCSSAFVAMNMLQKHLSMKYCDTNATSMLNGGIECRRCPRFGSCVDGVLHCNPGFVERRGRCLEDVEFRQLSERLAYSASELLSKLAGRAECGENVPRGLSYEELGNALHTIYSRRKHSHDQQKFEDAMAKAIVTLQTDDTYEVNGQEEGYLFSESPKFSLSCRLKRKAWEYKRPIIAMILLFLLIIYFRVKRYLQMLKERRLDDAHLNALEYLRDQVNAFRNNEEDVAFVPDVVLREEVIGRPTTQNKKFWKEVEERLNRDPRVIRKHQVLKGMPSYTFEYVGSRRSSGRRSSSGNFFETSSRRSSFGSRASLDSFDLGPDPGGNGTERSSFIGLVARLFSQRTE